MQVVIEPHEACKEEAPVHRHHDGDQHQQRTARRGAVQGRMAPLPSHRVASIKRRRPVSTSPLLAVACALGLLAGCENADMYTPNIHPDLSMASRGVDTVEVYVITQ